MEFFIIQQFRRICYPPAWSMRIYYPTNDEEPTPALPKGGSLTPTPFPSPREGGQGTSTYTFRRICYPPELRAHPQPLPKGGGGK